MKLRPISGQVGDVFYDLTFLGEAEPNPMPSGGYKRMAHVRCKCGIEYKVQLNNLRSGKCRCCRRCASKSRPKKRTFTGDVVNRKQAMQAYRRAAHQRNLTFELTPDQFNKLTAQPCFYCGVPPSNVYCLKHKDGSPRAGDPFIYSGIDRVDSAQGYTVDNVVPCCTICNMAKMDRPLPEMIAWAVRFINRMKEHENGTCLESRNIFSEEVWREARKLLGYS